MPNFIESCFNFRKGLVSSVSTLGNSCYRSCAHGQGLLCLQLRADEAKGSIQWKMTLQPRLCVKTADNCDKSYCVTIIIIILLLFES